MNRTWKVTGGVAVIALAAAACSSGSGGSSGSSAATHDVKLVQSAYTTTAQAKTAKIQMQVRITQGRTGQQASISATGGVNIASQQGQFDISLPRGIDEQIIYAGRTVYEKLPEQVRSRMHVNTPWISIDVNKVLKAKTGSSLAQLQQQQPDNPLDQLGYLRSVSTKVTKKGTATIDGTKTTHYRAQIDLDKQKTAAVRRLEQALGSHSLPVQVWIDAQGRLRKMQLQEKVQQPSTGPSATVSMQLKLSDFGASVSVQPPPKDQTTDVTAKLTGSR